MATTTDTATPTHDDLAHIAAGLKVRAILAVIDEIGAIEEASDDVGLTDETVAAAMLVAELRGFRADLTALSDAFAQIGNGPLGRLLSGGRSG